MANFCKNCGGELTENQSFCTNCGSPVNSNDAGGSVVNNNNNANNQNSFNNNATNSQAKSRVVAGLLGVFLGAWGVHNFYLGFNTKGVIQIVVTILSCGIGSLWGFIEGILILTGNINEDANGVSLKE